MAQIKTKNEIEKIKKACRLTDAIFAKILHRSDLCKMTEIELRDFILLQINKRGLKPSFPPIVTSGKRAGNEIHPKPTNKKLQGFTIIDFGVIYEKYMSDMTRTIYLGKPTKQEISTYTQLLLSQKVSIKKARAGIRCSEVDALARKTLGPLSKYFIHMLGHGVGTKIHESPRLFYKLTKPVLKENMIITIEPGIYLKNKLGIRIEDTCLIIKKGCIPLTKSRKGLIVIR